MDIISLDTITKSYGAHTAVDSLTLAVPRGSIYGFIGPNGSGKTTTLRMIMNILYPDSGNIRVFGEEPSVKTMDRIGYLPEERGLYRKMRVRELIAFYAELKHVGNPVAEADYWLDKFDLGKWASKKIEALSKGMSQKVQFIVAVINRPGLLLLDEPFSGLDPVNAEIVKEVILELRSSGSTIVFSTHDMSTAEKMCDFIFMIHKGRKVLDGTLASIQEMYGMDTVRVQTEGGIHAAAGLAGVEKINDFGQVQELRLVPGTDPQSVLQQLLMKTRVIKYEVTAPSLNDIFIRIARPETEARHE